MKSDRNYSINPDLKFGYSTLIDVREIVDASDEEWFNQALCVVNDCVVRLGIVRGEFHWHKHEEEDELFFVLEGRLVLDLKDKTVEIKPHQGYTVPKGVMHRTRAPERTVMLMIEGRGVKPTGD